MDYWKQGSLEIRSSEEYEDNTDSTKRSFKCTFCRRGFTNAQALGGHMNIHRKDRAKGKQLRGASVQNKHNEESVTPEYFSSVSNSTDKYFPVMEDQRNYHTYSSPPSSSPSFPHSYHQDSRRQGVDLSLQTGPILLDEEVQRAVWKNNEVDLELRLGYDP